MDYGHWQSNRNFNPDKWFGFVYRITNLIDGREYIGRKHLKQVSGGKWTKYISSSNALKKDIETLGKENFKFEIISLCKSLKTLIDKEVEIQKKENVLKALLPNGKRKYYNRAIANKKFLVEKHRPETIEKMMGHPVSEETRRKISKARKGIYKPTAKTLKKASRAQLKRYKLNPKPPMSAETKEKLSQTNIEKAKQQNKKYLDFCIEHKHLVFLDIVEEVQKTFKLEKDQAISKIKWCEKILSIYFKRPILDRYFVSPLGRFETASEAAQAHGITTDQLAVIRKNNPLDYYYVDEKGHKLLKCPYSDSSTEIRREQEKEKCRAELEFIRKYYKYRDSNFLDRYVKKFNKTRPGAIARISELRKKYKECT